MSQARSRNSSAIVCTPKSTACSAIPYQLLTPIEATGIRLPDSSVRSGCFFKSRISPVRTYLSIIEFRSLEVNLATSTRRTKSRVPGIEGRDGLYSAVGARCKVSSFCNVDVPDAPSSGLIRESGAPITTLDGITLGL